MMCCAPGEPRIGSQSSRNASAQRESNGDDEVARAGEVGKGARQPHCTSCGGPPELIHTKLPQALLSQGFQTALHRRGC